MASETTQLLTRLTDGERSVTERLLPEVYERLRTTAAALLAGERVDHSLSATALVHEAYLKLIDQREARWQDRAHFCAVAALAMRRILVDHARRRKRAKRGGGQLAHRIALESELVIAAGDTADLVRLDEAMNALAIVNAQATQVVELRYFGGMTIRETAAVLGVSESTVERQWRYARAWLYRALEASP